MLSTKVIIMFLAIFTGSFVLYNIQFYRLYQGKKPIARQIIYAVLLSSLIMSATFAFTLAGLLADQQKIIVISWTPFIFISVILWFAAKSAVKYQQNMVSEHG